MHHRDPLAQAISAAEATLRMRRMLEQASAEWENADRSTSFLWGQDRVTAAVSDTRDSYPGFTLTTQGPRTPPPNASVRYEDAASLYPSAGACSEMK